MWYLTACKILVSLPFFELDKIWNDFLLYLWINVGNINSEIGLETFHFKNERLTEFLQSVKCHILWLY